MVYIYMTVRIKNVDHLFHVYINKKCLFVIKQRMQPVVIIDRPLSLLLFFIINVIVNMTIIIHWFIIIMKISCTAFGVRVEGYRQKDK